MKNHQNSMKIHASLLETGPILRSIPSLRPPNSWLAHVVRADGLRNVTEGVHLRRPKAQPLRAPDGGAADRLLVRLQQLQKVETDAVPLARRRQLGAAIRDPADAATGCFKASSSGIRDVDQSTRL